MAKHTKKQSTGKYQPFRNHIYFVPFMLICGFFMLWLTLLSLGDKEYRNLGLFIPLTVLCFVMSKLLSDPLRITFTPSDAGLTVTSIKKSIVYFKPWDSIRYGYTAPNFKGHRFLILSSKPLDQSQIKQLVHKATYFYKSSVEDTLLIYLDPTQDTSQLLNIILSRSSISFNG
jgi:hypothetical protein